MIAEVLSTGNEVLLGDIVDTNSSFLCRRLKEIGIAVAKISAVGDTLEDISRVLEAISTRTDICIVTGGLGPTGDDITAEACAMAAGTKLKLNKNALESMNRFFAQRGYPMTPANEKQAMLPSGAAVLENNFGTAPGFSIQVNTCLFFFMPGVPVEMKKMFSNEVKPILAKITGGVEEIQVERLMVFGLPESVVGEKLTGFEQAFPGIHLGFRARFPMIEVKLVDQLKTGQKNNAGVGSTLDLKTAKSWVAKKLGKKVISEQGLTLAQEVGRLLSERKQTLSVAESCTGGLIANLITDVSGASDYFFFSATTYANEAKVNILNVAEKTLIDHGAVHEKTAEQMAVGAKQAGQTDWAISTTGIAGPTGGTDEKPVGTVCIGLAGPFGVSARRLVLNMGDRERNKQIFAAAALEMLRRQLI